MTTSAISAPKPRATQEVAVKLTLLDGYAFRVDFDSDSIEPLVTDEPPPLGQGQGPAPSRLLVAAVANCLAASLMHSLRRAHVRVDKFEASAVATVSRNENGRWRIERIAVLLDPTLPPEHIGTLQTCTERFEDYCIVTESVRHGIDVHVTVAPT